MSENKKINQVKIICEGCDGTGHYDDTEFETGKTVPIKCGACDGKGYILYERWNK